MKQLGESVVNRLEVFGHQEAVFCTQAGQARRERQVVGDTVEVGVKGQDGPQQQRDQQAGGNARHQAVDCASRRPFAAARVRTPQLPFRRWN